MAAQSIHTILARLSSNPEEAADLLDRYWKPGYGSIWKDIRLFRQFGYEAYRLSGDLFPGINAATMFLLAYSVVMRLGGLIAVWSGLINHQPACAQTAATEPAIQAEGALFPGRRGTWHGFERYDFAVDGQPVLVVVPRESAPGQPWVWHGEFFGHKPEPDIALLGRGFHIVYMKIPDLFGAPAAVAHWDAFYKVLTEQHGLAERVALVGVSRGGLYCYNWAAANSDKVSCIYGDAPVCDLKSWPLGMGAGTGNTNETPNLLKVYGVSTIDELLTKAVNPIDQLELLAKAGIPLLHVYGDADTGVPWEENTGVVAERYRELGGEITLIAKPGVGHVHGLDDSTPIIEFIARHSLGRLPIPLQE